MKFLLVAPRHEIASGSESPLNAFDASMGGFEMTPSTSIATVAAFVPDSMELQLVNETTQPLDFDLDVDVVGITANVAQAHRALEIAGEFRRRGKVIIMGGPHVSLLPEMFEGRCDSMVIGELESVADQVFADLQAGALRPRYMGAKADMRDSPPPRWDLYPSETLVSGVVQSSRGCPFSCNFCDVIQYLGNKQRYKDVEQVIDEIQRLYDLGFNSILIADDNFTANRKKAREVLERIAEWNGAEGREFISFQTQMSINMTTHDDMLELCHRAGILTNFVGIESSDPLALQESDKRPNQKLDLVQQCEKSVRAGVKIEPALIVGFDSDTKASFVRQFEFVQSLPAGSARIGALVAPVATPLFEEMKRNGRLLVDPAVEYGAPPYYTSNFEPAQMSRRDLYIGLRWLISRLFAPESFLVRLESIVNLLAPPPWIGRQSGPRRKPRRLVTSLASTVLSAAKEVEDSMHDLIHRAHALIRSRPETSAATSEVLIRYLAILVNLHRNDMYDRSWANLSSPPFDSDYADARLERLKQWRLLSNLEAVEG